MINNEDMGKVIDIKKNTLIPRDVELEFKLVLGKPLLVEKVGFLYPLSINEIDGIGLMTYYQLVSLLTCDEEEIKKSTGQDLKTMDYILKICLETKESRDMILSFLTILFKEEVYIHEIGLFCLGEKDKKNVRTINLINYEEIKKIIKLQNCIKEVEKKSEKVRKFEDRLAVMRKKYGKENETTLVEILSAISAKHPSINLLNIGELTIFQIYNQLNRLSMIEAYQFNFDCMINGASSDDASKTKHWSSRIDEQ